MPYGVVWCSALIQQPFCKPLYTAKWNLSPLKCLTVHKLDQQKPKCHTREVCSFDCALQESNPYAKKSEIWSPLILCSVPISPTVIISSQSLSTSQKCWNCSTRFQFNKSPIIHFTVACLLVKSLNRSEAKGDAVMIQTLLLFKCKLLCYYAD